MSNTTEDHLHEDNEEDFWGDSSDTIDVSHEYGTQQQGSLQALRSHIDPDTIYYYIRNNDIQSLDSLLSQYDTLYNLNTVDPYLRVVRNQSSVNVGAQSTKHSNTSISRQLEGGFNPLMIACQYGYGEIVQLLVGKYHASPLLTNKQGQCALHFALMQGHFRIVYDILSQWYHHTQLTSSLRTYETKQDLLQLLVYTFTRSVEYYQCADKTQEFLDLFTLLALSGRHSFNLSYQDSHGNTIASLVNDFLLQYKSVHPSEASSPSGATPTATRMHVSRDELDTIPSHLVPVVDVFTAYHWCFDAFYGKVFNILDTIISSYVTPSNPVSPTETSCPTETQSDSSITVTQYMSAFTDLCLQPVYRCFVQQLFTHRRLSEQDSYDEGFFDRLFTLYLHHVSLSASAHVDRHTPPTTLSPNSQVSIRIMAFDDVYGYNISTIRLYELLDAILSGLSPVILSILRYDTATATSTTEPLPRSHNMILHKFFAHASISPHSGTSLLMRFVEDDNKDYLQLQLLQSEYEDRLTTLQNASTERQEDPNSSFSDDNLHHLLRSIASLERKLVHRVELTHYLTNSSLFGQVTDDFNQLLIDHAGTQRTPAHSPQPIVKQLSQPDHRFNFGLIFSQLTTHDRLGLSLFDHVSSAYNTPLLFSFICHIYQHYHLLSLRDTLTKETLLIKSRWFGDTKKVAFIQDNAVVPQDSTLHENSSAASSATATTATSRSMSQMTQFLQTGAQSQLVTNDNRYYSPSSFLYRFSRQYNPSKGARHEFLVNRWHAFYSQGQDEGYDDDDDDGEDNHAAPPFSRCVLPLIYRFPDPYDQIARNKLRSHLIQSKLIATSPAPVNAANATNTNEPNTAILTPAIMSSFVEIIDMEFDYMIAEKTFRFDYRQLFSTENIDDNDHILASYFNDMQSLESDSLSSSSEGIATAATSTYLPVVSFFTFIRLSSKKTGISKDRYKKIIDAVNFYTPPSSSLSSSHQQGTLSHVNLYDAHHIGVSPLLTSPQYFSRLLQLDYDDFSQDLNYKAQFVRFIRRAEVDIITYAQQCHAVQAGDADPTTINVSLDHFIDTIASLEICLLQLFGTRDAPTTLLAMYTRCIDSNMVNHPCFVHFIRLFMVYYLHLVPRSNGSGGLHSDGDENAIQEILQPFYMIHNTSVASMTCSPYHLIMHRCALELVVPIPNDTDDETTTDDASATTMSLLHSHLKTLYDDQLVPSKYISQTLSPMDAADHGVDHSGYHHVYDTFALPVRYVEKLYEQQVMGTHPIRENLYSKPSSSSHTHPTNPSQLCPDLPLLTWLFSLPQDCVDINDVSRPVLRVDDERDGHSSQHNITDAKYSILTRVLSFTLWTPSLTDLVTFLLQQPRLSLLSSDVLWCVNAVMYHNHYEFHFPTVQEDIISIGRGSPSGANRTSLAPSMPFAPQNEMTRMTDPLSIAEVLSNQYDNSSPTSIQSVYGSSSSPKSSSPCLHGVMPIYYRTTAGSTPLRLPSHTVLSHLMEYIQKQRCDGEDTTVTVPHRILFDAIDARVDPELMRLLVSLCAESHAETETDAGRVMYDPRPRSPYTPTPFSSSRATSQPFPPMLPPSLVTYLLTTCMMTVNHLAPSSDFALASIVTYFKDILDVFAIAGFFNIPDNDLRSTENFLLPLVVIPHIHRNTNYLIESYYTTFTPLVMTILKHSTVSMLSSFDTTIPMSIFQYYSHSLKHGDNGCDGDLGNYAPLIKPSGRTTTINGKEYQRATASVSIQALILSPPPFLHHTLLVNSIEQQHHLLGQLFNAGIDPNACVYNIHDFTMNGIVQCQCTSLEPSGNQTTYGDYDQQVIHSTLTLAIASTFIPNENTVKVKKDNHLQTDDFKLLDLILSLPSTNVSLHLPLIVLGDIMTIYDRASNYNTSKKRLLRKLVTTVDSVNDGSSSKHQQQVFHTSPIAVALHQPRALDILQKLTSHHSFTPQHVFSHDHHIDCLVTALCHPAESTRLARRLLQAGCPIGHGVLRHSQQDIFPLPNDDDEQHGFITAHDTPISFHKVSRQPTTASSLIAGTSQTRGIGGIGGSAQVTTVQYNPHLHYGSYYAYYPPLHTLDHIVTQLLRMESSVDTIAKTKELLLTDFHEYRCGPSGEGEAVQPPPQLTAEQQHEVDQCRDLTPFVKSFAVLLRSVLFFALVASDMSSSSLSSSSSTSQTLNSMIAELLAPQSAGSDSSDSDVTAAWEHYITVFDPHQTLIPSNHKRHDIDVIQTEGVRTQGYIALNQLASTSLPRQDDAQNDTQSSNTTIKTYFHDCIRIQKDIHCLLLFYALGQTNCVELLTIFHSFDDGHTFNIPSTIHPYTNDTLLLYAVQFHRFDTHMVECMHTLIVTYRCLVNVISSHFRLSLIELLFVQPEAISSVQPRNESPTKTLSAKPSQSNSHSTDKTPSSFLSGIFSGLAGSKKKKPKQNKAGAKKSQQHPNQQDDQAANDGSASYATSTSTPHFPIEIFKLLVENNCDIRRYDRCTSNYYYGSTLLVLACHNHSLHQVAFRTANTAYRSDHIQLPMARRRSNADPTDSSPTSSTPSSPSPSSPSGHPTSRRQYASTVTMISGAQLVIDTLTKIGCAVNTQFHMKPHQPVNKGLSSPATTLSAPPSSTPGGKDGDDTRPHSQLLHDLLDSFAQTAPTGIILGLINNGAVLSTPSLGYYYASMLTHPDDPEVPALVAEALCRNRHRYIIADTTVVDQFIISLYSHPYSHRMIDSVLRSSNASLTRTTNHVDDTSSGSGKANSNQSYFLSLFEPKTRNCEPLAAVLAEHGLIVNSSELIEVLHKIPPAVLLIFKPPGFTWTLETIIYYVDRHNRNNSSSNRDMISTVNQIRQSLGITTVYGIDFRKVVGKRESDLIPLMSYLWKHHSDHIPTFLALFYHLPEHRDLSKISRQQYEYFKTFSSKDVNYDPAVFPTPDTTARTVVSFDKELADPPKVYLIDYHHQLFMMTVAKYLSSRQNSDVSHAKKIDLASIEAQAIQGSDGTFIRDYSRSNNVIMKFKPLLDYYLDPTSALLRDAIPGETPPPQNSGTPSLVGSTSSTSSTSGNQPDPDGDDDGDDKSGHGNDGSTTAAPPCPTTTTSKSSDSLPGVDDYALQMGFELVSYPSCVSPAMGKISSNNQSYPPPPTLPSSSTQSPLSPSSAPTPPIQKPQQSRLFQQQPTATQQASTKYADIVPPLMNVTLENPSQRQLAMIHCNFLSLYQVEKNAGINMPPKPVPQPVKDVDSRVTEFLIFCYTFYHRFPYKEWTDFFGSAPTAQETCVSHVELALLNPYLTKTALEILLVMDEYQKQLKARAPFPILCHRHHADRFYDCFAYILSNQPGLVDETYSLTHSPTGKPIKISPLVQLSMFHGNRRCLTYMWERYYQGQSNLNSTQRKLLLEYCQPEYYDIFIDP